jgi:acyl-CoA thioesterase FadM
MTEIADIAPFRARVRYAECDAFGELQPMAWASLFDSALADALGQRGIELHELRRPEAVLRVSALQLAIEQPLHYDERVAIRVETSLIDSQGWIVQLQAELESRGQSVAHCRISHGWRQEAEVGVITRLAAALP